MDKPFDLNTKEILKKSEYQLLDIKKQYAKLFDDPDINNIGNEAEVEEVNADILKKAIGLK